MSYRAGWEACWQELGVKITAVSVRLDRLERELQ
jgi:hypothetical protein